MQKSYELAILPTPERNEREINVFQVSFVKNLNLKLFFYYV